MAERKKLTGSRTVSAAAQRTRRRLSLILGTTHVVFMLSGGFLASCPFLHVCSQMAASEWSRVVNDHASKASGSDFDADQFKKKVQRDCMTTQLKASVKMILFLLGYLLTGTFVFSATEGWPLFYSFYFSVVTMSTVGYGGSAGLPGFGEASTTPTRLFCIFYSAVGIFGIVDRISSLLEGISISTTAKLSALAELEAREQKRLQKQISMKSMYGTQALPGSRREVVEEPMAAWKFYTLNIVLWVGTVILWVLVNGAIFCGLSPGLTFFDGVYFSWITATTIGYSDSELKTTASRAWCCVFIIISTALITVVSAVYTSEKTKWQWAMRRCHLSYVLRCVMPCAPVASAVNVCLCVYCMSRCHSSQTQCHCQFRRRAMSHILSVSKNATNQRAPKEL